MIYYLVLTGSILSENGFTDDEIKNKIEELLRDSIWEHIPENKISIEFD